MLRLIRRHPSPAGGLLIAFALKREAMHVPDALRRSARIVITGMGPERADAAMRLAIERYKPDRVITAGVAGALCQSALVGDVLFDDELGLAERLERQKARAGVFLCHPTLAVKKAELRLKSEAHAVEMESGVIRDVCRQKGIPSTTLRAMSDPWDWDFPPAFAQMIGKRGGTRYHRAAWEVMRDPALIPVMRQLRRDMTTATRNLALVLGHLVETEHY